MEQQGQKQMTRVSIMANQFEVKGVNRNYAILDEEGNTRCIMPINPSKVVDSKISESMVTEFYSLQAVVQARKDS